MGRRELAAACLGVAVAALVVLLRSDGGDLHHGAQFGGDWGEHLRRLDAARAMRAGPSLEWLRSLDGLYPPVKNGAGALLGWVFGHGPRAVTRAWMLWSLLLVGAAVVVGRSWGARPGPVALVAGLLPPTLASSCVFHNDLPQFAWLWAAAAALVLGYGRGWRGGLVSGLGAGLCLLAACLTKWSAPLFAVAPLGAALLAPGFRWRRLLPAALAGLVVLLGVDGWLRFSTASVAALFATAWSEPVQLEPGGLLSVARQVAALPAQEPPSPTKLAWFLYGPFRLATGTVSPLLLPLLAAAALRARRAGLLLGGVALAQQAVIWGGTPREDDRFLLVFVPLLAVLGALGWARWGKRSRLALAVGWLLAGWWVAWDFHHGLRASPHRAWPHRTFRLPDHFDWRGLGATSTNDTGSGWVRRADRAGERYLPGREAAWAATLACRPGRVLVDDPALQGMLEPTWFDFRSQLRALRTGEPPLFVMTTAGQRYAGDAPGQGITVGWFPGAAPEGWAVLHEAPGEPALVVAAERPCP